MFEAPELDRVRVYFGKDISEVASLHSGESLQDRIEQEIRIHRGQIHAENYLLNTFAKFQSIVEKNNLSREEFAAILRRNHYDFSAVRTELVRDFSIPETDFASLPTDISVNTADLMRQRALMMGAVLSSTPVLLRDPWQGKPVSPQYGFADHKAKVGPLAFSAVATPRYKGIPFRFAVMKHQHDGYEDNNPAMIMSNEFCDAFEAYNRDRYGSLPPEQHPLVVALATNLKPNIHDRFHNWLLYDTNAASAAFQKWGDDIFFVDHRDKNPLLINYEQVAMTFHLYTWQHLFEQNPGLDDRLYQRLGHCVDEIRKFGDYLREVGHPQAQELEESTVYAVVSNIGFVLSPYDERFSRLLEPYPDVKDKLLAVRADGRGIGKTLRHLHSMDDAIPSMRDGGDSPIEESVFEYIIRYPLHEEVQARLERELEDNTQQDNWQGAQNGHAFSLALEEFETLPPQLKERMQSTRDQAVLESLHAYLARLPKAQQEAFMERTEVSEEGYLFFRLNREEIDYTRFEVKDQKKKVLLIEVPGGSSLEFTNEKTLSITRKLGKQHFHLEGGRDLLAINIRDADAAQDILEYATQNGVVDPRRALERAKELSRTVGVAGACDLYKISKEVAANLYGFSESGFYQAELKKHVAKVSGPVILELPSGSDQRLIRGALVYLPFDKDPAADPDADCHCIENTDYRRDYNDLAGTTRLPPVALKADTPLRDFEPAMHDYMQHLGHLNIQITHGREKAASVTRAGGLFS